MELIDKNKLLEKLKELKQNLSAAPIVVIKDVESLVESLEVKEVDLEKEEPVSEIDLEKEVRNFIKDNCTSLEEPDEFLTTLMQLDDMVMFAKHFYELGLKAKKGK